MLKCRIAISAACLGMAAAALYCNAAWAIVAGDPAGKPADTPQARIVPNTAGSPWAGVGRLVNDAGNSYTATVIGPRHVVTAAHAVGKAGAEQLTFLLYPEGDRAYSIKVAKTLMHPDYRGFKPAADGFVHDDIAIIELQDIVPFGTPVYPLLLRPVPAGTPMVMIGYGTSGNGVRGIEEGSGIGYVKRAGGNSADSLLDDNGGSGTKEVYVFDFDGPDGSGNFMGGGTLGNGVEATLGEGDSGSPSFVRINGRWLLAGINTFVTNFGGGPTRAGLFGTGGGGMLLSAYASWIMQAVPGVENIAQPLRQERRAESAGFKKNAIIQTHARHPIAIKCSENARCHPIPTISYKKS